MLEVLQFLYVRGMYCITFSNLQKKKNAGMSNEILWSRRKGQIYLLYYQCKPLTFSTILCAILFFPVVMEFASAGPVRNNLGNTQLSQREAWIKRLQGTELNGGEGKKFRGTTP